MVALQVKDSGIGMEEEEIGRIFEPFYRVDPSRSKRISGSGLGLSIVKTIAQAHGGWVEVESRKGEGTLFTLTLPAKRPPQPNFGEK